ncbi:MAG: hypothetical protein AB8H86_08870 [Polyangiales bacterium]
MFRPAEDDEIYARGESQLRVPKSLRAAVRRAPMPNAVALMNAAFGARAKDRRWWSRSLRCVSCGKSLSAKRAPSVERIDLVVALRSGPVGASLSTPARVCRCGATSYLRRAEVRELVNDVLVCCDVSFGELPGSGQAERARRRAQVRRVQ